MASTDDQPAEAPRPPEGDNRISTDPGHHTSDDTSTRILRRAPLSTGSTPVSLPGANSDLSGTDSDAPATTILRRHPTGARPVASEPVTGMVPRAQPVAVGPVRATSPDPRSAIATAVLSILSGWATGVIATDLITGWWATDPLFCVAMGFLTAVSAGSSISGVVALLLRRRTARLLIVVGAVIAVLIFGSLFVAGAALPAVVYALPLLPLASIVCAALPATARWSTVAD